MSSAQKRSSIYSIEGGYHGYTLRTRLVRERRTFQRATFSRAADIADFLTDLRNSDRERFLALPLTVKNEVIGVYEVSVGTLDAALVHPREVFKPALLASAASVALAHNHPSGDAEPSDEDIELTSKLVEAGKVLGIPVLDHVIIGEGTTFVSLAERGHV